jgi:hypothetical protein
LLVKLGDQPQQLIAEWADLLLAIGSSQQITQQRGLPAGGARQRAIQGQAASAHQ